MTTKKPNITDEERAARRQQDREFAEQAVHALRSSTGWQAWLQARGVFHRYSLRNSLLLAMQRPDATLVAGFKRWLSLGYCVRKGEKALRVWQPVPPTRKQLEQWRQAGSAPDQKPRTHFKLGPVFDRSQVDPLPAPATPAPLDPPIRPIHGDDLAPAWPSLVQLAAQIGSTVSLLPRHAADGTFHPSTKAITISAGLSVNQQVLALCHELAHALVRADRQDQDPVLDYAAEEWVAESVAFITCRALGTDTQANSVPYLASYLESAPVDTISRTAQMIDRLARRIEDAAISNLDAAADAHPADEPDIMHAT